MLRVTRLNGFSGDIKLMSDGVEFKLLFKMNDGVGFKLLFIQ